ncbi:MAG: C1 family peptidase [Aerococcus sp.]|nr:C1 family peptidase [Aerococcus sp.]
MIKEELLAQFEQRYNQEPANAAVEHAIQAVGFKKASLNLETKRRHSFMFSDETKQGPITNQKHSGRCWMFAALNSSRIQTMEKLKDKKFDFSKTYTIFYDKLEKSNTFLENILKTADKPTSDREVMAILTSGADDGGYWEFATGLLKKYGNVPAAIMPETHNSEDTTEFNKILNAFLRQFAFELRTLVKDGADDATIQAKKDEQLYFVYTLLVKAFGQVPKTFTYSYRDDDDKFHKIENITPQDFFNEYVGVDFDDMTNLINAPMEGRPYDKTYTLKNLYSVYEAGGLKFLHKPIEVLKEAAIKAIKDNTPLWFACDVTTLAARELGILDSDIYAYDETLGRKVTLDKGQMLEYHVAAITHAMNLVGVDLDQNGKPLTWKIENSWGEKNGKDGVFSMSDEWFDQFVYELAVPNRYLDSEIIEQAKQDPIELEMWDPFM